MSGQWRRRRDVEAPCGDDFVVGGVGINGSLPALHVLTALFDVTQTLPTGRYIASFGAATKTPFRGTAAGWHK